MFMEARKYIWEGAIPLQIHLHESEVTTFPPPPPAMILAPRIGYLPLLIGLIKPYFSTALPPGNDTVWFDYKGLPLKWYIPTGVLFDLVCAEPERPWNLTAAYIINGNCKNIMNVSQSDQVDLWRSVMDAGNLEVYQRVSSKLKLGVVEDEYTVKMNLSSVKSQQGTSETDATGQVKTGRIPIRLYVYSVSEDFDDFEDVPKIDSWDQISFINRPVEIHKEEGKYFTLHDAFKALLPEFFSEKTSIESPSHEAEEKGTIPSEGVISRKTEEEENVCENAETSSTSNTKIKLVRIQGIEPKLEIPFSWVVNNLINPDHFLHICVYIKVPNLNTM